MESNRPKSWVNVQRQRVCSLAGSSAGLACTAALLASLIDAQGSTMRVSVSSLGNQGHEYSDIFISNALSADGRMIVFSSKATDLVPGDINGTEDVFVHDCVSGATSIVSVDSSAVQGNSSSYRPSISADGKRVAFVSWASNLVPLDTNVALDIFIHDISNHSTERVSVSSAGAQSNASSFDPRISSDGRCVAFSSDASNLVPGDTNGVQDVFVRDLLAGTTTRVSVGPAGLQSNGDSYTAAMSADGRFVAFMCNATNLAAGASAFEIYVHDRVLAVTTLESAGPTGLPANNNCQLPVLSDDGRYVCFYSGADNLVAGDSNGTVDVFLRDRLLGITTIESVSSTGVQGNGFSIPGSISADARYVVFDSTASNLVPGDTNGKQDVFLRDRVLGSTICLSLTPSGQFAGDDSYMACCAADDRHVAFTSAASDIVPGDTNGVRDIFVRDLLGCSPTIASYCVSSTTSSGCTPKISSSGIPSASSGSAFTIAVDSVEGQVFGVVFYGLAGSLALPFGGGTSVLCVHAPAQRTTIQFSGGTNGMCDGHLALDWNQYMASNPHSAGAPLVGGETVWAQAWFRDPPAPSGTNLSDALWFTVCPN